MQDELLTISEAAYELGITKQGISVAILSKRLKFSRNMKNKKVVSRADLYDYAHNRYNRVFSVDAEGNRLYDAAKGRLSPIEVQRITGIKKQKLYYLIRKGALKAYKVRSAIVIDLNEIKEEMKRVGRPRKQKVGLETTTKSPS